jgi:hypothetical protein
MKLRFIGADGSMGLRNDGVYDVRISTMGNYIVVEVDRLSGTYGIPYSSLTKFFANWSDL